MHTDVKHKLKIKHKAGLQMLIFNLWLHGNASVKRKIEKMLGMHHHIKSRRKGRKGKRRSGHPQRSKSNSKRKLTKEQARARFKKLLPKINAGRRRKGLKPIRIK